MLLVAAEWFQWACLAVAVYYAIKVYVLLRKFDREIFVPILKNGGLKR